MARTRRNRAEFPAQEPEPEMFQDQPEWLAPEPEPEPAEPEPIFEDEPVAEDDPAAEADPVTESSEEPKAHENFWETQLEPGQVLLIYACFLLGLPIVVTILIAAIDSMGKGGNP